ncbi:hypothetical protein LZ30DRAFT_685736 [Colletotrichum cereale]|nr:hypothetical protein LZ30DRAFT_685736 [Colletotrichum cereale]
MNTPSLIRRTQLRLGRANRVTERERSIRNTDSEILAGVNGRKASQPYVEQPNTNEHPGFRIPVVSCVPTTEYGSTTSVSRKVAAFQMQPCRRQHHLGLAAYLSSVCPRCPFRFSVVPISIRTVITVPRHTRLLACWLSLTTAAVQSASSSNGRDATWLITMQAYSFSMAILPPSQPFPGFDTTIPGPPQNHLASGTCRPHDPSGLGLCRWLGCGTLGSLMQRWGAPVMHLHLLQVPPFRSVGSPSKRAHLALSQTLTRSICDRQQRHPPQSSGSTFQDGKRDYMVGGTGLAALGTTPDTAVAMLVYLSSPFPNPVCVVCCRGVLRRLVTAVPQDVVVGKREELSHPRLLVWSGLTGAVLDKSLSARGVGSKDCCGTGRTHRGSRVRQESDRETRDK